MEIRRAARPFPDKRILIVDDNEYNRMRYSDLLSEKLGCQVETAESKEQAIAIVQERPPHLVLLDVCLPDRSDGIAVCHSVKNGGMLPEVQVVMITALDDSDEVLMGCYHAGCDDFLAKKASNVEVELRVRHSLLTQEYWGWLING